MRPMLFAFAAALSLCVATFAQDAKPKDDSGDSGSSRSKIEIKDVAGKSLEQWIKEVSTRDPSRREHAIRMILGFEPEKSQAAVPAILAELKKHTRNKPVDVSVRIAGAVALGTILKSIKEPNTKQDKLIREAVVVLRDFCRDEQVSVRTCAAQALAGLGPMAHSALSSIIHVAQDQETWQAREAGLQCLTVLTLLEKEFPSTTVQGVYQKALEDNAMQVRIAAVQALARFPAPTDPKTADWLLRTLEKSAANDRDAAVRIWANLGVMTVKKKVELPELTAIAKGLDHADPSVRLQAAQSIALIGKDAKDASGHLQANLYDPEPTVVAACIVALARVGAVDALPALKKLTEKGDTKEVRQSAERAVEHIENLVRMERFQGAGKRIKPAGNATAP